MVEIKALACELPVRRGLPLAHWSLNELRREAMEHGVVAQISGTTLWRWLSQASDARPSWIAALELQPGARVLEVGVGTGANLPYLPADIDIYGVDLSWGMLNICSKKLWRSGGTAHLFQAEAERLPFRAAAFDCVFHTCGIRRFSSPARAVREMIWVARPGARIVIVERAAEPARRPGVAEALGEAALASWVPEEMEEIETHTLGDSSLECLTFRVPREPAQDRQA